MVRPECFGTVLWMVGSQNSLEGVFAGDVWPSKGVGFMVNKRVNIKCKGFDLVNKRTDTDCRPLASKLCDLIYLLAALISVLSHSA